MPLIVTWHPTYAFFHNAFEWGAFSCDLDRFARLVRGELRPGPRHLLTSPTAMDVRRLVREGLPVAVDIETAPEHPERGWTGKDPTRAQLKTVGLGNTEWGLSFQWGPAPSPLKRAVADVLADARVLKVFHNGYWFDLRVLSRYGFVARNVIDTRDARRAISSTSRLALGYLASLYDDTNAWKEDDEDDAKGLVFTDDLDKLKRYNAQDCVETARVWEGISSEDEWQTPRVKRLYEVHEQLSIIAAEMHTTGFYVDQQKRQELADTLEQQYYAAEAKFLEKVGIPGFKCTPNDFRALIFKRHETAKVRRFSLPDPIDLAFYTSEEQDSISVGKDALLLLLIDPTVPQELKELIDLYWAAESVWKERSTFVTSALVSQAIGTDGRLRPGWNTCGTDTMRWSCSEPNIMNIKQHLRVMYRAAPSHVLVHADKSQLELRVMAAVAQDDELQKRLDTGDVYSEDARDWFQLGADCDVKKLKPAARKSAKIIHLGAQYAAGTNTIYSQALRQDRGMKFQLCDLLHKGFKKTYHRTVSYWGEEQERVRATGYSEGRVLFGRRTYPREPPITEVANYPIQRTAAEMMNVETIELWRALKKYVPKARLIAQLHDALDVECREKDRGEVERIMQDVLGTRQYTIEGKQHTFPIEMKVGTYWSEV